MTSPIPAPLPPHNGWRRPASRACSPIASLASASGRVPVRSAGLQCLRHLEKGNQKAAEKQQETPVTFPTRGESVALLRTSTPPCSRVGPVLLLLRFSEWRRDRVCARSRLIANLESRVQTASNAAQFELVRGGRTPAPKSEGKSSASTSQCIATGPLRRAGRFMMKMSGSITKNTIPKNLNSFRYESSAACCCTIPLTAA